MRAELPDRLREAAATVNVEPPDLDRAWLEGRRRRRRRRVTGWMAVVVVVSLAGVAAAVGFVERTAPSPVIGADQPGVLEVRTAGAWVEARLAGSEQSPGSETTGQIADVELVYSVLLVNAGTRPLRGDDLDVTVEPYGELADLLADLSSTRDGLVRTGREGSAVIEPGEAGWLRVAFQLGRYDPADQARDVGPAPPGPDVSARINAVARQAILVAHTGERETSQVDLAQTGRPGGDHGGGEMSYDQLLDRVAHRVPAFAGLYRDGGTVVVGVTDGSQQSAQAAVDSLPRPDMAGARVHAEQERFSWLQLRHWYLTLREKIHEIEGIQVNMSDVDEKHNVIVFGIGGDQDHRQAVRAKAASIGIPAAALQLMQAEPIQPDIGEP